MLYKRHLRSSVLLTNSAANYKQLVCVRKISLIIIHAVFKEHSKVDTIPTVQI